MPSSLLITAILVVLVTVGLAWPLAARFLLSPAEKLVASCAISLIGAYLWGFTFYVFAWSTALWWLLPVVALANLTWCRGSLRATWADPESRAIAISQVLVTAWCVGWLAVIVSYSGGGWIGDWFGHWQRSNHFLDQGPADILFNGFDPLPSRPPLVNVVTAVFLRFGGATFGHYQLVMTLLGSLAFAPAAMLAARFGGRRAIALLAVFVMLNPSFVQNATFSWTKLPAAFFTLAAVYFFLRARDADAPGNALPLCAMSLAAATLAHYSAGPYVLVLAMAWGLIGRHRWPRREWWRSSLIAAIPAGLLLGTWLGWSLATYGTRGTFLTNTTVTDQARSAAEQVVVIALNLRDTLVPHFLRAVEFSPFAQPSSSGWWRDWFFLSYQVNLPFAFGSVGWLAILAALPRAARDASHRVFWICFVAGIVFLGIAVHSGRNPWGLAHICLQPLVLMGLAFLASRWRTLPRGWRLAVVAGCTADFMLGIVLHFGVQSGTLDRWLGPGGTVVETLLGYSEFARMNLRAKLQNQWAFVADVAGVHGSLVPLVLAGLLALALRRAARRESASTATTRPRALSVELAMRLALAAVTTATIACLWAAWCEFPGIIWNELRLAPAFALRHGIDPYPPAGGGPLSTWIYGPVAMILNLPATWATSAAGAVQIASLLNALTVLFPMAVVFFGSAELHRAGAPIRWLALGLGILLLPRPNLVLQVADHASIAFGIIASWVLARETRVTTGRLAAAALLVTLAIWSKQVAVFLVLAHVVFLLPGLGRGIALRYLGWVVMFNVLALAACIRAFGFSNLWLNLVEIPGKLPWAEDLVARLTMHATALLAQLVLPAVAIAVLWRTGRWPSREHESGRFWHCSVLTFAAMVPVGIASLLKYGGNTNVLHSWAHLLPAALLLWLARDRTSPAAAPRIIGVAVFAFLLRWPDVIAWRSRPETGHYERAARITAAWPQGTWFPNNPLITFYADGRLWHTHDGIVTRDLARFGLREVDFRRHIPAELRAIVYPQGVVFPVGLQLLPEFNQTLTDGFWKIHLRDAGTPSTR